MSKEPKRNVYVGHRYVPLVIGEWEKTETYEGLSIVTNEGTSYTSKKRVPVGIDIKNEEYWVVTGNYNAQIEEYRKDVRELEKSVENEIETIDSNFKKIDSNLKTIGINPINFGAKFNGIDDDTEGIKKALQYAKNLKNAEVIFSGSIILTEEIEIPSGITIKSYNAVVTPIRNNNVFNFNQNTNIKGVLTIDIKNYPEFSSSVLFFDGHKKLNFRDIFIEDIRIFGNNARGMGNAIFMDSSVESSAISFVHFGNVVIRGFEYGVRMNAPALDTPTLSNYINGNIFDTLTISDCDYYIFATGNHEGNGRNQVDGNSFNNVQLQSNSRAKEFIHFEGWNNFIEGFNWDTGKKGLELYLINLTKSSRTNVISLYGNLEIENQIIDNGRNNFINKRDNNPDIVDYKSTLNYISNRTRKYNGAYENILHKADILHDLNILEGSDLIINDTEISNIFQNDSYNNTHVNLNNNKQLSFELEINGKVYKNNPYNYLKGGLLNLGISFSNERTPKNMFIEITDNENKTFTNEVNFLKENRKYDHILKRNSINGLATDIKKIKFTLIGQNESHVEISNIFAKSTYIGGIRFMSNDGGIFTGDVEFLENVILKSDDGSSYKLIVDNDGTIKTLKI